MTKMNPKRWKGCCMLHEKWKANGRHNWAKVLVERKASGRGRRFTNHADPTSEWTDNEVSDPFCESCSGLAQQPCPDCWSESHWDDLARGWAE